MKACLTLFITTLFFLSTTVAQDTTTYCRKKTIVIRKSNLLEDVDEKKAIVVTELEEHTVVAENLVLEQKKDNTPEQELAKMPTLAGGEFGLMNIQPYYEGMDLQSYNYVAIQYSVNEYGWAIKTEVLKTNNAFLKSIVLEKLRQAKWNPPINKKGEPFEYRMYPQVVLVKGVINEEDYYND